MLYEVSRDQQADAVPAPGERPLGGVYSLIECPPVGRGNFILLRREDDGASVLLAMGRVQQDSETLNLAHIRRLGAELGANQVRLFPA